MPKYIGISLCVLILGLAGCGDATPEAKAKQISELLTKNLPMTGKQSSDIKRLTLEAKKLQQVGKAKESGQVYDQALKILRQAEDAALFNKAD